MKVTKILETIKTGTGKKGAWTLVKVEVGDKTANGFMPVSVGDEVDLTYNDEYKNYNFKVLEGSEIPNATPPDDVMTILTIMDEKLSDILSRLDPPITTEADVFDE